MTFRERTLSIFRKEPVDNIVYQPRIEHWYGYNKARGVLPERYKDISLLDLYDDLGCSIRPYHYFNDCLRFEDAPDVVTQVEDAENFSTIIQTTPIGSVTTRIRKTDSAKHRVECPVKTDKDADVMEYILRGRRVWFDLERFQERDAMIGDRAAPMLFLPRVNMQRILLEYVGWQETMYMLSDSPELIERLVDIINQTDEPVLQAILESPMEIINFGDNVDEYLLSPPLFKRFVLPVYQDRGERFRKAGKFTHTHFDGNVKHLLQFCGQCNLSGFEALTPHPQGDLTIQEMKDALGDDLILLDGIPMTAFMPDTPWDEFERATREIIETFAPNLILGISDEPSPVCDIERVRRVSEIVKEYET